MQTETMDDDTGERIAATSDSALVGLRATQPLRDLHRANAAFSGLTGVAMAAAGGWLARHVDLPTWLVVVVGAGLVGWAALLIVLAVQPARRLAQLSASIAVGDAAWVIATAALVLLRHPTAAGTTMAAAAAVVVGGFATAGFVLGARARRHPVDGRTELLFRSVAVAATPAVAWPIVLDADLYARLAPNLTAITVAADGCSRTCTDTLGNRWTEATQLDPDRYVQRVQVDVAEHPMPLDELAATIAVRDDPVGSRIDIAFTYATRATLRGLATSMALPVIGRRLLRPITRGWARHASTAASTRRGTR